jgi:hypothetical protein
MCAACCPGNQLNESLPDEWANWSPSEPLLLSLAENQLTGTLPASWGSTGNLFNYLTSLDLHSNNLNGSIPATWPSITNLGCWSLADNQDMCGPVPGGMVCPNVQLSYIGGCHSESRCGRQSCSSLCSVHAHVQTWCGVWQLATSARWLRWLHRSSFCHADNTAGARPTQHSCIMDLTHQYCC